MKRIHVLLISSVLGIGSFIWLCSMDWKIALAVGIMFYANNLNNNLDGFGNEGPTQHDN